MGNFHVKIRKKARHVDYDKCTGCGICIEKCPRKVIDDVFEAGMGYRKAIYTPFPQAVPRTPVIDTANCTWFTRGKCQVCSKVCPTAAVDYDQKDEIVELEVGNIIMATGWKLFDCKRIPQYGYGRLANVYSNMEFERLCNAAGPTNGKIVLRDGKTEPKSVAIIHCVGSRDVNSNPYCSSVCCMAALKFGHLVLEKTKAEVYSFYIDLRTPMKDYEEFYQRLLEEGMHFVRGKVAEVTDAARLPSEEGKLIIQAEDTLLGKQRRIPGRYGDPDGRTGAAGRRQGTGPEVRHFVQHGRLVYRASPQARPRGHDDRRRVRGRRVPGAEGHSGLGRPGRRRRRPHAGMITKGEVMIEPIVASIDEEHCSGCRICNNMCPYNAIEFDEEKQVSRVISALCKGCGTCVAACPAGVITGATSTTSRSSPRSTAFCGTRGCGGEAAGNGVAYSVQSSCCGMKKERKMQRHKDLSKMRVLRHCRHPPEWRWEVGRR